MAINLSKTKSVSNSAEDPAYAFGVVGYRLQFLAPQGHEAQVLRHFMANGNSFFLRKMDCVPTQFTPTVPFRALSGKVYSTFLPNGTVVRGPRKDPKIIAEWSFTNSSEVGQEKNPFGETETWRQVEVYGQKYESPAFAGVLTVICPNENGSPIREDWVVWNLNEKRILARRAEYKLACQRFAQTYYFEGPVLDEDGIPTFTSNVEGMDFINYPMLVTKSGAPVCEAELLDPTKLDCLLGQGARQYLIRKVGQTAVVSKPKSKKTKKVQNTDVEF